MLFCVNQILWVLLPVVAAQYALALFCLTKLAYLKLSTRVYVVWNITILLVFFVGSIVFLVYYYKNRKRLEIKADPPAPQSAVPPAATEQTVSVSQTPPPANLSAAADPPSSDGQNPPAPQDKTSED